MWKSRPTDTDAPDADITELSRRLGRLSAENTRLLDEFGRMQQHFSGLARSVWRVQEDERRRLARELHDGVGQNLTALRHRLEKLPESPEREDVVHLVGQILEDVREMSRLLRPPVLDDLGLAAALQWLGRRVRESADMNIEVSVEALEGLDIDDDVETLVFRVVQEALHNSVRHADARSARIVAARAGNRIEVSIADDGCGFDVSALNNDPEQAGVGLAGMRDRVRLFDGDLAITSAPGKGTTITAGLPLTPARQGGT